MQGFSNLEMPSIFKITFKAITKLLNKPHRPNTGSTTPTPSATRGVDALPAPHTSQWCFILDRACGVGYHPVIQSHCINGSGNQHALRRRRAYLAHETWQWSWLR
jgi:hypothetical protein